MSGSSATVTEPAQLRWSVVRLTDLVQSLERENAEIRRENKKLQTSGNKALICMREKALETCSILRKDLTNIRQDMNQQMEFFTNRNQKVLKKSFQMFGEIVQKIKEDQKGYRANADDLSKEATKLKRDLVVKEGYISMLKKVASKLRQDLGDMQEFKDQAIQDKVESKMRLDDLLRALGDMTTKEQAASIENKRLREKVAYFERGEQVKEMMRQRDVVVAKFTQLVSELKSDKSRLEEEVASAREQVEKLTGALYSKSHFSTFVDLKQENIKMQSKLNELLKKADKQGVLGITTAAASHTPSNVLLGHLSPRPTSSREPTHNSTATSNNAVAMNNNATATTTPTTTTYNNNAYCSILSSNLNANSNPSTNPSPPSVPSIASSSRGPHTTRGRNLHVKDAGIVRFLEPEAVRVSDDLCGEGNVNMNGVITSTRDNNINHKNNDKNGESTKHVGGGNSAAFEQLMNIDILLRAVRETTEADTVSSNSNPNPNSIPNRAKTASGAVRTPNSITSNVSSSSSNNNSNSNNFSKPSTRPTSESLGRQRVSDKTGKLSLVVGSADLDQNDRIVI